MRFGGDEHEARRGEPWPPTEDVSESYESKRWLPENPWLRWPIVIVGAVPFALLALVAVIAYSVLGTAVNLIYVAVAVALLFTVGMLTGRWIGPGWIPVAVFLTFLALIPTAKLFMRLNKKAGWD